MHPTLQCEMCGWQCRPWHIDMTCGGGNLQTDCACMLCLGVLPIRTHRRSLVVVVVVLVVLVVVVV